ncbi:MAG TPA: NADH-quinone oxidoreductase subunit L [Herpetosiphonaceae bacterium]|nr:NADH-quinone oxidoreductase subunit L [Herpetosiphonaceae bacterium]
MENVIWLVPALPLLGVVINTLLGVFSLRGQHHHAPGDSHDPHHAHGDHHDNGARRSGLIASLMVLAAFGLTVATLFQLLGQPATVETTAGEAPGRWFDVTYWEWMLAGDLTVPFGFLIDQLSVTMMLLVTGVGSLIHIYSVGYMSHDPRPVRFFTYLNLFIVAMLMLIMGNNFLMLFLGWEGVGLCSFLLIGFWFEQRDPPWASTKAFVTNRVGDFGLLMAMFAIWGLTRDATGGPLHSLLFREVLAPENVLSLSTIQTTVAGAQYTAAGAIALMLLLGVTGKSAQIPLFVWLPDAMAGPTPVSALIHAATMVTAGVYLIIRTHPIFELSPPVMNTTAFVGAATAFVAATIAIGQYDIKKVLAFSTVSQLGYMVAAVGMGAYGAGLFHLLTHGIFKALLFLGAGAVIHGYGNEQDMRKMGGLRKAMPRTFAVYMIGTLALAGIFPLAGFWSKDEIIGHAWYGAEGGEPHRLIAVTLIISSMLTAFYMARQIAMVFFGEQRDRSIHAHESAPIMIWPLIILAVGTVLGGLINLPSLTEHMPGAHALTTWIRPIVEEEAAPFHIGLGLVVMLLALLSGWAGFTYYRRNERRLKSDRRDPLHRWGGDFYAILESKWGFDALYDTILVQPFKAIAGFLGRIFDVVFIDGVVNGSAALVGVLGRGLRTFQTGYVRSYALMFLIGVVAVLGYFVLR